MRTSILIVSAAMLIGATAVHANAAPTTSTAPPPAKTVAAAETLAKPLGDLSLPDTTLLNALVTLRQRGGVRLTVNWDALKAVGVTPASKTALVGRGMTLAQAMDVAIGRVKGTTGPLCWFVHGRNIHITSRAEKMRLRRAGAFQPVPAAPRATSRPAEPKVTLQFDATPMDEVVAFFRRKTGMNLTVAWPALEAIGVLRDTPVTLTIDKPIPITRALDLFVESLAPTAPPPGQVFWDAKGTVLTITSGEALDRELITRVFDVSDLLIVTPNFVGPSLTIQRETASDGGGSSSSSDSPFTSDRGGTASPGTDDPATARARREQQLIDAIRSAIGEPYWQPSGRGSIRILRGKMIITQTRLGFKLLARSLSRH